MRLWATYETLSFFPWLIAIPAAGGLMSAVPIAGAISDWLIWVQVMASAGVALMWPTILSWIISRFTGKSEKSPGHSQQQTESPGGQQASNIGGDTTQSSYVFVAEKGGTINFQVIQDGRVTHQEEEPPAIHVESHNQQGGNTIGQVNYLTPRPKPEETDNDRE